MGSIEERIFPDASRDAVEFYQHQGFCHFRTHDPEFLRIIDDCYTYYASHSLKSNIAFRNAAGIPRHVIDVFRDPQSPTLALYRSDFTVALIDCLYTGKSCLVFTHSKLSFKVPGAEVNWFAHQDNGYKSKADLRIGFAIFVCLEDMDESNGGLQLFPGSHKLGTLAHERVIEDKRTGENQLRIKSVPAGLRSMPVVGRKGDLIIFSCNMIHQSGSSRTQSKRLALIAEVEEYTPRKLDDYGKAPIPALGAYTRLDRLLMCAKSLMSPYTIWRVVKKNRQLALLVRKLRY